MSKIITKEPKIYIFRSKKARAPYVVEKECVADSFTASLSRLYHQMNENQPILKKGDKYISREEPWGYFRYKGKVWPIYNDDAGQSDYIYINGEACSSGSYNLDPLAEFIYMIDYAEKEKVSEETSIKEDK